MSNKEKGLGVGGRGSGTDGRWSVQRVNMSRLEQNYSAQSALTPDPRPLNPDLRVILFDIDGTLIRAVRRPEYRGRIRDMLLEVFGTCGRIAEVDFGGKTDLAIYREALECEGVSIDVIGERLPRLEATMVEILDQLASTGEVFRVCEGVCELLESLSRDERFLTSLLTGNVEKLAEAKLRVAGI